MLKKIVFIISICLQFNSLSAQVNPTNRQIVLQGFWWDYKNDNYPLGWANYLADLAPRLKAIGIDAVWIPPNIKNDNAMNSNGYSPFDPYDLGDKRQKGSLKTKMGDKDELLRMIGVLKANGLDVIQDIVLNHNTGAGAANSAGGQDTAAMDDGSTSKFKNFRYVCYETPASAESATNYLARKGRFSKNWENFYPNPNNPCCTNPINTPYWGPDLSYENDAFGQSSNATYNPIQTSGYTRTETRNWMIWYKKQLGIDGYRLDAVKHFPAYATEDFLWNTQFNAAWASGGNNQYAVGEYVGGGSELDNWCNAVQNRSGTFDFALRGAFQDIINGMGNYDLSNVPGAQQGNRQRTVPFVNNHDTFRPQLSASGNYTGWNTSQQLGRQIEPNEARMSMLYAISFAVDGAPMVFFEDLFSQLGYNGKRFTHDPKSTTDLPMNSDLVNLIWCHQNLGFKQGSYFVRWQAPDALVIERGARALIAVTDSWNNWQNLTGVQTAWPDGTVLKDYSGANGNTTKTVYGGGKVDIDIPPCNRASRKGYAIWAPVNINTNYNRTAKSTTQEWEMDNDLGDSHERSLMQGGRIPDSSTECRVAGKIFSDAAKSFTIEVYPADTTKSLTLSILDDNCTPFDSITGIGNLTKTFNAPKKGWYSILIRNANANQAGQKCWIKATYIAPENLQGGSANKLNCNCLGKGVNSVGFSPIRNENALKVYPNPTSGNFEITLPTKINGDFNVQVINTLGSIIYNKPFNAEKDPAQIAIPSQDWPAGVYFVSTVSNAGIYTTKLVKQ